MTLAEKVSKIGIESAQHHIFLCCDQGSPKCCSQEAGAASWEYLKRRIVELGLQTKLMRTKANCLRVCEQGPIAVVYPEGVWYHSCSEQVLEKILQEHILKGKVLEEFAFARAPLTPCHGSAEAS